MLGALAIAPYHLPEKTRPRGGKKPGEGSSSPKRLDAKWEKRTIAQGGGTIGSPRERETKMGGD